MNASLASIQNLFNSIIKLLKTGLKKAYYYPFLIARVLAKPKLSNKDASIVFGIPSGEK